jgi:hypothetical protein
MPYADPDRRREYNREYKQKQRAQATTKKRFNTRQTASEIETVDDVPACRRRGGDILRAQ